MPVNPPVGSLVIFPKVALQMSFTAPPIALPSIFYTAQDIAGHHGSVVDTEEGVLHCDTLRLLQGGSQR